MAQMVGTLPASVLPAGYVTNATTNTTASERQGNMKGRKPDSWALMWYLAWGCITTAMVKEQLNEWARKIHEDNSSGGEEDSMLERCSWVLDGLLD